MTHCSASVLVIGLILIDRVQEMGEIIITSKCIHRILMTSVMVAAKSYDDFYYKNTYYSKVAGISLQELNSLEAALLNIIGFDISVQGELFDLYLERLQNFA